MRNGPSSWSNTTGLPADELSDLLIYLREQWVGGYAPKVGLGNALKAVMICMRHKHCADAPESPATTRTGPGSTDSPQHSIAQPDEQFVELIIGQSRGMLHDDGPFPPGSWWLFVRHPWRPTGTDHQYIALGEYSRTSP